MADKRILVRFAAEGSRDVRLAMEGIGEAGTAAMRTVSQSAAEMSRQIRGALNTISRETRRVGLALTAVSAGVTLAVRQQVNAADEMGKAASRLGVSVEELSALEFAARLSGSSLSELETALTALSRRAVESPEAFEDLGISLRDASGAMRPTADLLSDVADALAALPAGADRTAAAMELLGRSGTNLIPMLEGGAAGLGDLTDQAARFGAVISTETAANAAEFNDNLTRLTANVDALWRQLTEALLPGLLELSENVLGVVEAFGSLPPEALEWFAKLAPIVAVGGPLLLGIAALTKALALLVSPFLLIVGAIAAVVTGIVLLIRHFDDLEQAIMQGMAEALVWLRQRFEEFRDFLHGLAAEMVQIGRDIIQGFADGIMERWQRVRGAVEGVFTSLTDGVRSLFGIESPSRVFAEIGAQLIEGLTQGLRENMRGPVDQLTAMGEVMQTAFGGVDRALQELSTRGRVNFSALVASMTADLSRLFANRGMSALLSMLGGGATLVPGPAVSSLRPMAHPPSFEGGGFTGRGPRSGGLDGRGGFLAMLHPNETVTDHSRGRGGPAEVVVRLGDGLMAEVLGEARDQSVRIVREGLEQYDRFGAPAAAGRWAADPRRRG